MAGHQPSEALGSLAHLPTWLPLAPASWDSWTPAIPGTPTALSACHTLATR